MIYSASSRRDKMGRLIEGFWACNSCGKTGIRGSIKACPDCGKLRDKDTKFYLDPTKSRYVPKNKSDGN